VRSALPLLAALALVCCSSHVLRGVTATSEVRLPADHAAHDDAQTEWWHLHGHLVDGRRGRWDWFLAFVRQHTDLDRVLGIPVRWFVDPFEIAYFTVLERATGQFLVRERHAFPDAWVAGARTDRLDLRHGSWRARMIRRGALAVHARAGGVTLSLGLRSEKPPTRMGRQGVMELGPDSTHLYYTMPRWRSRGTLVVGGERRAVQGPAWFKHQWGFLYSEAYEGWDWFGVQLSNGLEIGIVFEGGHRPATGSYAVVVERDGTATRLDLSLIEVRQTGDVWRSPRTDTVYPTGWVIEVPRRRAALVLRAVAPAQEMVVFPANLWAGTLAVEGVFDGEPVTGDCFAEIVGLDEPFGRDLVRTGRPRD
jgi:predicted secreted hydrolase